MYNYSEKTKKAIGAIGSGDMAYIPNAIACAVHALEKIATDESLSSVIRDEAAFAAANLILSDHTDD